MKILTPDLYFQSIVDVKIELLKERKIKGLIIDIDNTLVGWDVDLPTEEIIRWLENIKHQGFKICLVSNNNRKRVELFAKDLNLPYIFNARKPMRKNLRKAMKILETSTEETCIVGDQIFTDILGGNLIGVTTILLKPIKSKEFWWTAFVRKIEKYFIKKYQ